MSPEEKISNVIALLESEFPNHEVPYQYNFDRGLHDLRIDAPEKLAKHHLRLSEQYVEDRSADEIIEHLKGIGVKDLLQKSATGNIFINTSGLFYED